ncbi:MAG: hypothetical protein JWO95_3329 [Verrucomicrobiales bacterium]|nr:hypothetical protein [Verrucomicrobiales bacterium]
MRYKFRVRTKAAPHPETTGFEREQHTFQMLLPKLLRKYCGEYVAVFGGHVLDHDKDDSALAARMFKKVGEADFYIGRVEEKPAVYELPSPEIA